MNRILCRGVLPLLAAVPLLLTACSDDTSSATSEGSRTTPSSGAADGTTDVGRALATSLR